MSAAAPFFEEALALSRRIGDRRNIAGTLHNLAEVERQRGNYERAKTLGMESMALAREMEDKWQLARIVGWVGLLTVFSGDEHDLAEGFLKEALTLNRELGSWAYGAYCLEGFAGLAGARGQGGRAARLWGAAEALRKTIGAPLSSEGRLYFERSMVAARAQLGEAAWEAAFAQGMAMSTRRGRRVRPLRRRFVYDRFTDSGANLGHSTTSVRPHPSRAGGGQAGGARAHQPTNRRGTRTL